MRKLTENQRRHIGETLTIRWGTSRGRDSYGYTTCSLRNQRGRRVAACNGGGYDMRGTVIGNWIAATFPKELCSLKAKDMPRHSHWQPDYTRICVGKCYDEVMKKVAESLDIDTDDDRPLLPQDCETCPTCGGDTNRTGGGTKIDEGHYLYGLKFYDPHYDVMDAKLEHCDDTFTKPEDVGKTFKQLQTEGKLVDLHILQTWYKQTSRVATSRHTVPTIDGACGESSVMQIMRAIGMDLRKVHGTSKVDVYEIVQAA